MSDEFVQQILDDWRAFDLVAGKTKAVEDSIRKKTIARWFKSDPYLDGKQKLTPENYEAHKLRFCQVWYDRRWQDEKGNWWDSKEKLLENLCPKSLSKRKPGIERFRYVQSTVWHWSELAKKLFPAAKVTLPPKDGYGWQWFSEEVFAKFYQWLTMPAGQYPNPNDPENYNSPVRCLDKIAAARFLRCHPDSLRNVRINKYPQLGRPDTIRNLKKSDARKPHLHLGCNSWKGTWIDTYLESDLQAEKDRRDQDQKDDSYRGDPAGIRLTLKKAAQLANIPYLTLNRWLSDAKTKALGGQDYSPRGPKAKKKPKRKRKGPLWRLPTEEPILEQRTPTTSGGPEWTMLEKDAVRIGNVIEAEIKRGKKVLEKGLRAAYEIAADMKLKRNTVKCIELAKFLRCRAEKNDIKAETILRPKVGVVTGRKSGNTRQVNRLFFVTVYPTEKAKELWIAERKKTNAKGTPPAPETDPPTNGNGQATEKKGKRRPGRPVSPPESLTVRIQRYCFERYTRGDKLTAIVAGAIREFGQKGTPKQDGHVTTLAGRYATRMNLPLDRPEIAKS